MLKNIKRIKKQKIPQGARFFGAESSGVEPHSDMEFSRYQLGVATVHNTLHLSPQIYYIKIQTKNNPKKILGLF